MKPYGAVSAPTSPSTSTAPAPVAEADTNARHLYVSTIGSDSNSGAAGSPLRTIQAAADAATPGTTIHVAAGTYRESIRSNVDGTAQAPIRFVSDVKGGAKIMPSGETNTIWWNAGDYTTIQGFEVDGSNSPDVRAGISAHGNHVYVKGNHVHHILTNGANDGTGGAGIGSDGSYFGDIGQHFVGNVVHDIGGANSDGRVHGIYHQSTGSVVNNVVYNTPDGITTGHDAHDILIANNTVVDNGWGISIYAGDWYGTPQPADRIQVINNVVANSRQGGITEAGWTGTNNVYSNNLMYGNGYDWGLQNGLTPTGTVKANPLFVNAGAHDYRLQAGSSAVNYGTAASAPATDLAGYARPQAGAHDIGAYEWSQ
jgi:hypothetical protein